MELSKTSSLIIVILCYIITFPLASFIVSNIPQSSNYLIAIALWDFIESTLLFGFAFAANSISIIDLYWKLAPFFQMSSFIIRRYQTDSLFHKHLISLLFLSFWALRLLYNYLRSWPGLHYLDFRVKFYKDKFPNFLFWPIAYMIFFIVSGFLLYLAKLPLMIFVLECDDSKFQWVIVFGWGLMFIGVLVEAVADKQLFQFRRSERKNQICDDGLWYYCRHPNYLGEVLFWWGSFFTAAEILEEYPWTLLGPVIMNLMFVLGSGPWMDQHLSEKRKEYGDYMKCNKSLLIPWFRSGKMKKEY